MNEAKGGRAAAYSCYINRDADQPVYAQLAESLQQQIAAGVYLPGERLPSEAMLVDRYKVSPMTVRRAINLLVSQGIVTTVWGSGTFVKEVDLGDALFYLQGLKDIFNDAARTTVRLLEVCYRSADERTAAKLRIKKGERVIFIRRLLLVAGEPAFYHRGYLINDPNRPVVESELEVTELKGIFEGYGSSLIKHGDVYLEATILEKEEAEILKTSSPAPGMILEHIFYDFDNNPVSWGWFVCSSTRLRLHTRVGIERANGRKDERI